MVKSPLFLPDRYYAFINHAVMHNKLKEVEKQYKFFAKTQDTNLLIWKQ